MFRRNGTARPDNGEQHRLQGLADSRAITSELAETLAVLVVPAILLSGINLFFFG
jgi:hypothetical protein